MSVRPGPPTLVLGLGSLELTTRGTRDRALELAQRFREPESLAVMLVKAMEAGVDGVLAPPTPALRAALAALSRRVPVLARLPFVPAAADLQWEPPLFAAADTPAPWPDVRGGIASLGLVRARLTGDLAARVADRLEREAALVPARSLHGVVLAAGVTDLVLAAGHARGLLQLVRFARARWGLVGLETRNLGQLLSRLADWRFAPDFVLGPVNSRGFGMKPSAPAALAALQATSVPVLATELTAGATRPLEEGGRYALAHGARGVVTELVELNEVPGDLRALAAAVGAAATGRAPAA